MHIIKLVFHETPTEKTLEPRMRITEVLKTGSCLRKAARTHQKFVSETCRTLMIKQRPSEAPASHQNNVYLDDAPTLLNEWRQDWDLTSMCG